MPKKVFAGRTKRLRKKIIKFLEQKGQASSTEIYEHLNSKTYGGTTPQQIGNILAQDPRFRAIGTTRNTSVEGSGMLPGVARTWDVMVYDLSLDYKEWS